MEALTEASSDTAKRVEVATLGLGGEADWNAYVAAHPSSTIFHTLKWRNVIRAVLGHEEHYLMLRRGGRVAGVLPLAKVSSFLFGTTFVSVPFAVYGGIVADDEEAARALLARAAALAQSSGAKYVEMRHLHRPLPDLPCTTIYSTFIADIPATSAGCLERIPRKARAEVRQALRNESLAYSIGGVSLDELHGLFSINKRRLGSPIFPSSLFWHVRNEFGDDVAIHAVQKNGATLAAVMSFIYRDTIMPYYSGAAPYAERDSASNYMYFKLMEWASERGLRRFDFGRSRQGTGAYAFKKHQGFEPTQLWYDYVLNTASATPELNPSNPKFELAKRMFARMPLWMAQKVGSWLTKRAPF
jgi:FemAB-related protein (PEP-CTERM system-associated)